MLQAGKAVPGRQQRPGQPGRSRWSLACCSNACACGNARRFLCRGLLHIKELPLVSLFHGSFCPFIGLVAGGPLHVLRDHRRELLWVQHRVLAVHDAKAAAPKKMLGRLRLDARRVGHDFLGDLGSSGEPGFWSVLSVVAIRRERSERRKNSREATAGRALRGVPTGGLPFGGRVRGPAKPQI